MIVGDKGYGVVIGGLRGGAMAGSLREGSEFEQSGRWVGSWLIRARYSAFAASSSPAAVAARARAGQTSLSGT
jgi:hypothetical protein